MNYAELRCESQSHVIIFTLN